MCIHQATVAADPPATVIAIYRWGPGVRQHSLIGSPARQRERRCEATPWRCAQHLRGAALELAVRGDRLRRGCSVGRVADRVRPLAVDGSLVPRAAQGRVAATRDVDARLLAVRCEHRGLCTALAGKRALCHRVSRFAATQSPRSSHRGLSRAACRSRRSRGWRTPVRSSSSDERPSSSWCVAAVASPLRMTPPALPPSRSTPLACIASRCRRSPTCSAPCSAGRRALLQAARLPRPRLRHCGSSRAPTTRSRACSPRWTRWSPTGRRTRQRARCRTRRPPWRCALARSAGCAPATRRAQRGRCVHLSLAAAPAPQRCC